MKTVAAALARAVTAPVTPTRKAPVPAPVRQEHRLARDLGGLIAWLRGGERTELPFRRELEQRVRGDLSGVESYRGERARKIADTVGARAFAVGNVVGFTAERPGFGDVAHEVAHVVQMLGPSPRAWDATYPIGVAPWDSPYELPDRTLAEGLAGQARGPRAPIAIYRNDKPLEDTKPETVTERAASALLAVMRSDAYKLQTFTQDNALFAMKDGTDEKQVFLQSSPKAFRQSEYLSLGYPEGTKETAARDDLFRKIFGGDNLALTSKFVVDGRQPRMAKVRYGDSGKVLADYVFVGLDHTGGVLGTDEVFARKGRPGGEEDAQHPKKTLGHYKMMFTRLQELASAASKSLPKVVAVENNELKAALERAANPDNKSDADLRSELTPLAETVRRKFVQAVADSYDAMEDLHAHAFASNVFSQPDFLGKNNQSPYQRFKAQIFETWLADRGRQNFERVKLPKEDEEKVVQPIFAKRPSDEYIKSDHLQKVRHGDGVLRIKGEDFQSYAGIAEAKAYTKPPETEERAQMQDYARILTIPIPGFFEVIEGKDNEGQDKVEIRSKRFKHITYFFSDAKVAGSWLPSLDELLGSLYTAVPDPRKDELKPDDRIKEIEASIARLETENLKGRTGKDKGKSTLVGIVEVKANLTELKAKPDDERKAGLPAIEAQLVKAVVDSYEKSISDVYTRVLEDDKVFPPALASIAAAIVQGWLDRNNRKLDESLESPPHGERRKVRPLFDTAPIAAPKSPWGKALADGSGSLDILDDRFVMDKTSSTEKPTDEEVVEMTDVKEVHTKKRIYLVVKGGAGARFVPRELTVVEYQFAPEASDVAALWRPKLLEVFKQELDKDVFVSPDPKAEKHPVFRFQLNPTFEAKVDQNNTLTPPVTITSKHPGIKVDNVEVTLTAVGAKEITGGSVTFGLVDDSTKGVITSDGPETKPITPATGKDGNQKPIQGRVENRLSGLKSKLDSLLERIRTDAKLVDKGFVASLRVTAGPSGIPKVDLDDAVIEAKVEAPPGGLPRFSLKGGVGISTAKGKIKGRLGFEWKNGALKIEGNVRVENLIDGLAPVDAKVIYKPAAEGEKEQLEITIVEAAFRKQLGAVTIGGKATNLKYDFVDESFSGQGKLSAELGSFGKADAEVTIERNILSRAVLEYKAPQFRYPKTGTPLITGNLSGTVIYEAGEFSGGVSGKAVLAVPALKKLSKEPIELSAEIFVNSEGELRGGFEVAAPVQLGDHFRIEKIGATINEKGEVSAKFTVSISNIPLVGEGTVATIACEIADGKFTATVDIHLPFGRPDESRFWGYFNVKYDRDVFVVTLSISVKLKKGMVATGTLTYNTETRVLSGTLTLPLIPLVEFTDTRKLFGLGPKQIAIVQIPGLGLYIDIDFQLLFALDFQLAAQPYIALDDFDLKTKEFKGASAAVQLVGRGLSATLTAVPSIGLGAFAFHPKILRGGGGIRVPIRGVAKLEPSKDTVAYFKYLPAQGDEDAKVTAGARIALSLTFAVDAAIEPWAEFVVLDGLYKAPWKGQPLATFPLLPPREIYTLRLDFGEPVEKVTDPKTPDSSKGPPDGSERKTFTSRQEPGGSQVKEETPDTNKEVQPGDQRPVAGDEAGFDIKALVKGIVGESSFADVWELIEEVGETIERISKRIRTIIGLVKKLFGDTYRAMIRFLKGLKEADYKLITYVVSLLGKRMSPTLFYIVEPILLLLTEKEDALYDLIDNGVPTTTREWIEFALNVLTLFTPLTWTGPVAIAETIYRLIKVVLKAIADQLKALFGVLVSEGLLGARQNRYYVGSETVGELLDYVGIGVKTTYDFWAPDEWKAFGTSYPPDKDWPIYEISQAPAAALWGALWFCGAPKNSSGDYWF